MSKAKNDSTILDGFSKDNESCLAHLSEVIMNEAKRLNYQTDDVKKGVIVNIVASLVHLDENNLPTTEPYFNIVVAAKSYAAIKELDNLLNSTKDMPLNTRLEKYNQRFQKPSIQEALQLNPDSKVKQFLKTTAYVLLSILTLGNISKTEFLGSEQQKLYKRTLGALREEGKEKGLVSKEGKVKDKETDKIKDIIFSDEDEDKDKDKNRLNFN